MIHYYSFSTGSPPPQPLVIYPTAESNLILPQAALIPSAEAKIAD